VINISQSYTYLKATTVPNFVRYRIALPLGNDLVSAEKNRRYSSQRAHPYVSLCFVCTSNCPVTIVSPSKWNMRLFHRHD
jgi:hypothetical protein